MSSNTQNIIVGVVALVLIGLGYVVFIAPSNQVLDSTQADTLSDQMLMKTQQFLVHRAQLDTVAIDASLFSDPRFTTLRVYTKPLNNPSLGNSNPFAIDGSTAAVETE